MSIWIILFTKAYLLSTNYEDNVFYFMSYFFCFVFFYFTEFLFFRFFSISLQLNAKILFWHKHNKQRLAHFLFLFCVVCFTDLLFSNRLLKLLFFIVAKTIC